MAQDLSLHEVDVEAVNQAEAVEFAYSKAKVNKGSMDIVAVFEEGSSISLPLLPRDKDATNDALFWSDLGGEEAAYDRNECILGAMALEQEDQERAILEERMEELEAQGLHGGSEWSVICDLAGDSYQCSYEIYQDVKYEFIYAGLEPDLYL